MSKTLLYRLFGIGRVNRPERDRLASEGIACLLEGIPLTIAWRDFRQAGRRVNSHQQNTTGAVAFTRERLRVYACSKPVLDVGLTDPTADRVTVTCPKPNTLAIRLQAQDFQPDASGQITYWLLTTEAAGLADLWQQRGTAVADR
jgi:hypothetical protein